MSAPTLPAPADLPVDAHGRHWQPRPDGGWFVRVRDDGRWRTVAYSTRDPYDRTAWRVLPAVGGKPERHTSAADAKRRLDEATRGGN